jgi:hypothetical protein
MDLNQLKHQQYATTFMKFTTILPVDRSRPLKIAPDLPDQNRKNRRPRGLFPLCFAIEGAASMVIHVK